MCNRKILMCYVQCNYFKDILVFFRTGCLVGFCLLRSEHGGKVVCFCLFAFFFCFVLFYFDNAISVQSLFEQSSLGK